MSISGNLKTMPFADLLQWLSQSRKTGTLVVEGHPYTKKIYFSEGDVVAVASENPKEFLGYYLVGWGLLDEDELQELLEMQERHGSLLGELLVIIGRLSRDELLDVLSMKIEETVYDLFLWEEASFRFLDRVLPQKKLLPMQFPVDMLVLEGIRRMDEWGPIRQVMPDGTWVPSVVGAVEEGRLEPYEEEILAAMNGDRTAEQVALACRVSVFAVCHLASRLVSSGAVAVRPPDPGQTVTIPGFGQSSWRVLLKEVEAMMTAGDLLGAYRGLRRVRQKYPDHGTLLQKTSSLEDRLHEAVDALDLDDRLVLELAPDAGDLKELECGPEEGFLLSRVNGIYTLGEILKLLPGTTTEGRLMVDALIERGVLRVKESSAKR